MKILLVCGSGASTGFLVQSMRKSAKKRGLDNIEINARSESLLEEYIEDTDVLLAGPHMKFDEDHIKEVTEQYKVPYDFIDQEVYGMLNGEAALDMALKLNDK